jgi:hypothetical protein
MSFQKQLFISYAHIDNQPLTPEQQGWVSRFHASLEAMLSMRLGRKVAVWRDQKLAGNDVFADEILAQFSSTAVMVSVLSPRYVESEWCTKEMEKFCEAANQSGGLLVENKSRVIKVIKTPVDSEAGLPAVIRGMLGYPFYVFSEENAPLELGTDYGAEMSQKYNLKVATLAWDIAQLLKKLEKAAAPEAAGPSPEKLSAAPPANKPVVYLAECSKDRRAARETLEMDLKRHGYSILPDRQLPWEEKEYVAEVGRLLEQCKLSIHLIGSIYEPLDGQQSIAELQNRIARDRSRAAALRRLIWLPDGTVSQNPLESQFIEGLHSNAELQCGADLITANLETLKGAVYDVLAKLEKPEPAKTATGEAGPKEVYLLCDPRDRESVLPIRKFLKARGLSAKIPVFEGDSAGVRQAHQDLLGRCDALLLYYGAGDEAWKRTLDSELEKMKEYRGGKPLLARYLYLASPVTADKRELIELEEANLINGLEGFSEATMEPFVKACA